MPDKERYYQMNAGVEAYKAAQVYGHAFDILDNATKAISLKAKTKALIAQNPNSGLKRETSVQRQIRFPTGLVSDFWI